MNTIPLTKKKSYDDILYSDDSSSGSDKDYAMLQHNRGRIAVQNDEKGHTQEEG